ncbi:nuclear transport factor 2 family protein [uncultured Aquimarina sp.]|uniref:nuclear transport factor 2 family protein n=1 Tax=uncultured Aquimarina sp. TaxID=575652 RepID=UPI0026232630|nr:nuclear transport factor 2 family protein [uncultured Aquimarina sp.]
MKNFLTLFLLLTISITVAQESDRKLVEQTVNYYLEGGTKNDFETLKKAFHKNATMKYISNGYQEVNAIEFFKKGMKPGPKQNRKTKITNIDISGHAASARLEIEYATFSFIDYMNLLKIDGEWKIVSKIFYRKPHDKK